MAHVLPFRRLSVLFLGSLALAATGCGDNRSVTSVSGKVTVAGTKPLPGGNITFYLISDPTQVGGSAINSDGTFEVMNAPVGECKVVVDNTNLDGSKSPDKMMMGGGMSTMGAGMGSQAAAPGPSASSKEKMKNASGKAEMATEIAVSKDTGTRKYMRIDPAFTKVDTTTLRHTVASGKNSDVTFDVK